MSPRCAHGIRVKRCHPSKKPLPRGSLRHPCRRGPRLEPASNVALTYFRAGKEVPRSGFKCLPGPSRSTLRQRQVHAHHQHAVVKSARLRQGCAQHQHSALEYVDCGEKCTVSARPQFATAVAEPYNTVLCVSTLPAHTELPEFAPANPTSQMSLVNAVTLDASCFVVSKGF